MGEMSDRTRGVFPPAVKRMPVMSGNHSSSFNIMAIIVQTTHAPPLSFGHFPRERGKP